MVSFPLNQVQRCHVKMIDSGKLTFEIVRSKHEMLQVFVSKADPTELNKILRAMEEAQRLAKELGANKLPQTESMTLMKERFPEQVSGNTQRVCGIIL